MCKYINYPYVFTLQSKKIAIILNLLLNIFSIDLPNSHRRTGEQVVKPRHQTSQR